MDNLNTLWSAQKFVNIVKIFYDGFKCGVVDQEEASSWFGIKSGVKQGYNISVFLFLVAMDWTMRNAIGGGDNAIRWNLPRLC